MSLPSSSSFIPISTTASPRMVSISPIKNIINLPREILNLIAEELFDNSVRSEDDHYGHEDRKNFRLVCKEFHSAVRTDRLFRILSLNTDVAHIYNYPGFEKHPGIHLIKDFRVSMGDLLNLLPKSSNLALPRTLPCQCKLNRAVRLREPGEEPEKLQTGMSHSLQMDF